MSAISAANAAAALFTGGQTAKKSEESSGFDSLLSAVKNGQPPDKAKQSAGATDSLLSTMQQMMVSLDLSLLDIGRADSARSGASAANITGSSQAWASDGTLSWDGMFNMGGPLPAYLETVQQRYGLDEAQMQSLREIAYQFRDTGGSAAEVKQMADALNAAGIA